MPRPSKRDDGKRSPRTETELFKQSLYGELTTPEAAQTAFDEAEKKKKKGGFRGHENFYFWLYAFTEKHFAKKKKKGFVLPEIDEYEIPELDLGDKKRKKKKKKKEKKKKELPKSYTEAFDFMGWKLDPDIVMQMPKAAGILAFIIGILIAGIAFPILTATPEQAYECGDGVCAGKPDLSYDEGIDDCPQDCDPNETFPVYEYGTTSTSPLLLLFLMFVPIFLTLGFVAYVQKYPVNAAEAEKMRALTYVPEIMNYMVMQMRLQPNLESAVKFASEHGEGRIAEEFKEVLWKNNVGIYESIEEGLDEMAYRWEPYSEEFKHAITMIRASVLVPNDVERGVLYDKAIDDLLMSTKDKMELYAQSMKQPSMYLFYIAVLMPLMIIIMLPVAAAFAGLPVASTSVLIALYIFILPTITYLYARSVLSKRPGGYVPPKIEDDNPDLPKKGTWKRGNLKLPVKPIAILLFIVIIGTGWFLDQSLKVEDEDVARWEEINQKEFQQPTIIQYIIPVAFAIPVGFYLYGMNANKRQVQQKIFKMELDFKDAMYLLASRLGEKKPLEDSLAYVGKFMPESKVATELLDDVQRNIMVLGLTLRSAIFDETYGAMRYVPSRLMNSAFRIMVDSIELGPEVASTSLISVSDQIRNIQKINDLMKKLLNEVTSMMSSMARFIAPVVLGIVASLQQVIIAVIAPLTSSGQENSLGGGISADAIAGMATPFEFQLIVALYIIELVTILSYFSGKIEYGDNRTAILINIGKTLPVATLIFVVSLYMGGGLVGGLSG